MSIRGTSTGIVFQSFICTRIDMKLIDSVIKSAKPRNKRYSLPDGNGLLLWILPTGKKLWRYRYYYQGKEKMLSLGSYPAVSLKQAREKLIELKEIKAKGVDPSVFRQEQKYKNTMADSFQAIGGLWWEMWKVNKTDRHANVVLRRLENDIYPVIGNIPVNELKPANIVMTIKKIESRGASDVARRALNTIGQVLGYAVAHGYAEYNCGAGIRPANILKPVKRKNFASIDPRELPELLKRIRHYDGSPLTRLGLQLLALTFVRTSELIEAQWQEIDWNSKTWRIPAERMKMNKPHIVPLSDQAVAVLMQIKEFSYHNDLIFPGNPGEGKTMSYNTLLFALYRMGYHRRMTGHGFRSLASTILHENNFNHEWIELQLAHSKSDKVSAAYDKSKYLKQRREMMIWWGNYIQNYNIE